MAKLTLREQAIRRMNQLGLEQYEDILIDYDWPNQDEHYAWVVLAPAEGIREWCETIREGESAN